jgi:hypothetical protein
VPGTLEIPELRHGDTAQGERGRIVAQCHPLQCTERIACRQRPPCGRDQRVHLDILI